MPPNPNYSMTLNNTTVPSEFQWTSFFFFKVSLMISFRTEILHMHTRDVFYVRRKVDLMKTAKVNAYFMHIFGKIELLSIHAT